MRSRLEGAVHLARALARSVQNPISRMRKECGHMGLKSPFGVERDK